MKYINWMQGKVKLAFYSRWTIVSEVVGLKPQAGFRTHPLCWIDSQMASRVLEAGVYKPVGQNSFSVLHTSKIIFYCSNILHLFI